MIINNLSDLNKVQERAVIVNVNTKLVTTLALLSTIRHAKVETLLIDSHSTDNSFDHFKGMMKSLKFDMISTELRNHGQILDWVFKNARSEKMLLVDSDLEILDPYIINFCRRYIDEYNVFGCGFTNGPAWLTDDEYKNSNLFKALYIERMWIPLTFLRVDPIQMAINDGKSFVNIEINNDYTMFPFFSKLRKGNRLFFKLFKNGPSCLRNPIHFIRPHLICYATGAQIYQYLKYEKFLFFVGLPESASEKYVHHYRGITRNTLDQTDTTGCLSLEKVSFNVRKRIIEEYPEHVHF